MKREIKFRGKIVDNGEWVYGDLIQLPDNRISIVECETFTVKSSINVIRESVGQYTGLKDRNSVEIYEDDTVQPYNRTGQKIKFTYVIKYHKGGFYLANKDGITIFPLSAAFFGRLQVIGNIHDNTELIKQ